MVALRKGAIVVVVVALGYMIIALQARSADMPPVPGIGPVPSDAAVLTG